MRHNTAGRKLGRKTGHRLAMFRNQLASLVASERIVTTVAKAKELRPIAERIVTHGKRDTVHARRLVGRWVSDRALIKKLFDEIAPRFASRPGGYLRIVKLGSRRGDGAEMAVLEFVDFQLKTASASPVTGGGKAKKAGRKTRSTKGRAERGEATDGADGEPETVATAKAKGKAPAIRKTAGKKAESKARAKPATRAPATKKKASTPKKIGGS